MAWLSAAAVVVGVLVVGALILLNAAPAQAAIRPPAIASPTSLANGRTLGLPTARVTIDVWADFQCPSCGLFTEQVEPQLVSAYVIPGKARIVFHDFAFIGVPGESLDAAVAARCAGQQGAFWPYHDYLFANQHGENQGAFSRARLLQIADLLTLDHRSFEDCLNSASAAQLVLQETDAGKAAGVNATPTILVNGKRQLDYSFPSLKAAIDAALGQVGPSASPASSANPSAGPGGTPTASGSASRSP